MTEIAPLSAEEIEKYSKLLLENEPLFAVKPATVRGVDYERVFALSETGTLLATLAGFFNAFNNVMQVELDASHMAALAAQRGREAAAK